MKAKEKTVMFVLLQCSNVLYKIFKAVLASLLLLFIIIITATIIIIYYYYYHLLNL